MGIFLVPFAVFEFLHQLRHWIADLLRDREIAEGVHVGLRGAEGVVSRAVLLRLCKIRDAVREINGAFRVADSLAGAEDCVRDHEGGRLGETDIFTSKNHHAAGNK